MALSPTSQWTLVACGVIAHADGVLDGEECDRLMAMVEDEADGEEYSEWLATISDKDRLEELLSELPVPPEADHREILESAWTLAVVDGERTEPEDAALLRVAEKLGVESMQLDFWREAWNDAQRSLAENAAHALIVVLGGAAPVHKDDRPIVRDFAWQLLTSNDHREELVGAAKVAHDPEEVAHRLSTMPRRRRAWVLKGVAAAMGRAARPDEARERFLTLAEGAGLDGATMLSE